MNSPKPKIMKPTIAACRMLRQALLFLFMAISVSTVAQPYNNEWIRNGQTYYKFKVPKSGLYRITKPTLDAAGIGNSGAEYFELWRNGKQVPIYTSSSSGPLANDGYIEFWGEGNDGRPDKTLYRNAAFQHHGELSLFTDTAMYFLSVNTNMSGFTYFDPGNDVDASPLPVEPYFMHKASTYYKNKINTGFAAVVGEYVYSSSYDKGEFWSSVPVRPPAPLTTAHNNLRVYAGPDATLTYGAMGDALNPRTVKVSVNNTVVQDTILDYFYDVHASVTVPAALISSGNASVKFENTSAVSSDRYVVSYFELLYPRQFNFDNLKQFKFSLPASATGYKLNITNFNYGAQAPLLLDISSGQRIVCDISVPGVVRAIVGPGGAKDLVLVNSEASNVTSIATLTPRTFKNFLDPANQGDYLIISNKVLFNGTHGNNPVDEYRAYRASAAGGGFNANIIDVDELIDQFAFGIKKHPLSIKNFLKFARAKFGVAPKYVFLIGRGMTYAEFRANESNAVSEQLNLVPTFGYPGSDNLLSSPDGATPVAVTPIGRLSVVRAGELEDYLEKLIEYESVQKNSANTLEGREWMKNVVHVSGSSEPYLGTVLCNYLGVYRQIIQDTIFGAKTSSFCKVSTNTIDQINSERIAALFNEGISILTYFGHSSATTLEFNLDNPNAFNNEGKYPIFFVNGCNAGNFFTFNPGRLMVNETLSEKFTLAKKRGSIAFVASTHFGIVNYLNIYLNNLYKKLSHEDYGKSLGEITRNALQGMLSITGADDYYARLHAEELTIHGDPAIMINGQQKPDYVVEDKDVKINPAFISIAENAFKMKARFVNLGNAPQDSIYINVKRQYPDGSTETVLNEKIAGIKYADSLTLSFPIVATRDKGLNKIIISVDSDEQVNEISESNNIVTKDIFIFEDEARAIYPQNYAVINNANQKLFASTANPFSPSKQYIMELDTTELFNSSIKVTKMLNSVGGVLEFEPGITYTDSAVYYWRVATVPASGDAYQWNKSSFRYINGDKEGFAQAHYFQHLNTLGDRVTLDTNSRKWVYGTQEKHLVIRNGIFNTGAQGEGDLAVIINDQMPIASACLGRSIVFNVFDPVSFKPWKNVDANGVNLFKSGSASANCDVERVYNFEFSYLTPASRKLIMNFMDSIPDGHFVIARSFDSHISNSFSATWRGDTTLYGSDNSLYHKLFAAGMMNIDSINTRRAWIFAYKKGDNSFTPVYGHTEGIFDRISVSTTMITPDTLGTMASPVFGPAKQWQELIWGGVSEEVSSADNPGVEIIGIDANLAETVLYTVDRDTKVFDISGIDATQYPFMRLKMRNIDSVTLTPYQLSSWMVHFVPVPEGALAPNLFHSSKDTMEIGEMMNFGMAFKNVSSYDFDSLALKMNIVDNNNTTHAIELPKVKPLVSGDTVMFRLNINSDDYPGSNTLYLEFNPDKDQPEQYSFNNFVFKDFYVRSDRTDPLLDVTFDGVHILNRDIVSSRPHIQIKLKDEAQHLLLDDTALANVQIRYPDGTVRTYHFDNDTLRFTPATSGQDNSAVIDFYPHFLTQFSAEGDEYELIVHGQDKSGNKAGQREFRIAFTVITKSMISNLLNYPNPFSTSTAFVFTLTGSEIPQNMKIQILTVTGKVVREITKEELGAIRIGRNITEYKWDGTDQFGQKLANGVYLYRFVTTLNGRRMEKYKANGDNTDVFFNNGYGKMYLMR